MNRALGIILVLSSNLFALNVKLTNNLPDEFTFALMTVNSTTGGMIASNESENLVFADIGGAVSHNGQAVFSVFPTLKRLRVSVCCGFDTFKVNINGSTANCGVVPYNFTNNLAVTIEPCEK